jgi:hypothetical protein
MALSWMHKSAKLMMLAAAAISPAKAVLYGDEIYQDIPGGKFWAFYTEGIAVIDPETCKVETTITKDNNGQPLPNAFNDGVYMQSEDDMEGYILIGSRVDETNELGDTVSHMFAINTSSREVISQAEVGPRVVHSYGVHPRDEFWMHSDGNGLFYVFDTADLKKVAHDDIEAKVEDPSHGKLLWDEGEKLGNRGFATSTGEQYLFEIDLETKKQVKAFSYADFDIEGCKGLHAIAYSDLNMHVYAECSGGGGALEFDVSDGSIAFVQQFPQANGALYETPDGKYVVASSKGDNALYVFVPQGSGNKSSKEYTILMEGHPSTVSFYVNKEDDTIACSPMTENLNQNNIRSDGSIACDYYNGCTGAMSAADVELGICAHDTDDTLKLMRIAQETTVIPATCERCNDPANFETDEEGNIGCTCTPHCGMCDPNPKYSDISSGYMCVNLSEYVRVQDSGAGVPVTGKRIPNTGGMIPGAGYGGSPECSFGRTYRTHKRGMHYDAAVATIPTDSLVIIDMEKMEKKCTVELPAAPRKVVYAPNEPTGFDVTDSAASAHSASLVMALLGVMGVIGTMV